MKACVSILMPPQCRSGAGKRYAYLKAKCAEANHRPQEDFDPPCLIQQKRDSPYQAARVALHLGIEVILKHSQPASSATKLIRSRD